MLIKLRKAQNTAEYAIVLGLVVGAVVAMQVYVKRGLQSRINQFATKTNDDIEGEFNKVGLVINQQYEPYYLDSDFNVTRESSGGGSMDTSKTFRNTSDTVTRDADGSQKYLYTGQGANILGDE